MDYFERKKKRNKDFREKFAMDPWNGSYKLASDGCFKRHDISRDDMNMSREESNKKDNSGWNREEFSERQNLEHMRTLLSFGMKIGDTETMEAFVERGIDEGLIIIEEKI